MDRVYHRWLSWALRNGLQLPISRWRWTDVCCSAPLSYLVISPGHELSEAAPPDELLHLVLQDLTLVSSVSMVLVEVAIFRSVTLLRITFQAGRPFEIFSPFGLVKDLRQ